MSRLPVAHVFLASLAIVSCGRGQPSIKYETVPVDRGRIVARVTATGTLSALVTVQVGSQVSGRIAELHADFNQEVKKGELLARIDPQMFAAALDQAKANAVAAQGNLARAKVQAADALRQAERTRSLVDRKLIAQADDDTAQANAQAAAAQVAALTGSVEQARASLKQAEVNLAYTTISSPISGVVISRNVELGQTVAASLAAPTLFLIAESLTKMQVDTSVAEADIGKLKEGMTASFTVDAYPGKRFKGTLRQVRNSPQTVQNVVTYDAVITVENPQLELKPGMTANVTFISAEKDEVLRVSNGALRFRPPPEVLALSQGDGGTRPKGGGFRKADEPADSRTAWVLKDGVPAPVKLKVGVTDGSLTEVTEGELHEGDAVITEAIISGGKPAGAGAPGLGGAPPGGGRRMF